MCASPPFRDFVVCVRNLGIESIDIDLSAGQTQSASGGYGPVKLSAADEKKAAKKLTVKYAGDTPEAKGKGESVKACNTKFLHIQASPAEDEIEVLPAPKGPQQ
jgi:hypothetical protein